MNKIFITTLSLILLGSSFGSTYAQVDSERILTTVGPQEEVKHNAYKTTWLKNRFKDTWFITLGSGAQMIMASDDDKADFQNRITYAPSLTIGKYFSPIWGLKLNFTGGSLHGFNDGVAGTYRKWNKGSSNYLGENYAGEAGYPAEIGTQFLTWDPQWSRLGYSLDNGQIALDHAGKSYYWAPGTNGNLYMQHYRYAAASVNFMFDMLTLFGNYDPKRVFDITPTAGFTYAHVFPSSGHDAYDGIGVNAGLGFKFRLNDKFNFNVDASAYFYPDDFDGQIGGSRTTDVVVQAMGGITYKIGKSSWDVADPMNYELIDDLNRKINDLRDQLRRASVPCPDCPPCPEPEVIVQPKPLLKFLPDPVFFRLDKSVIDAGEWSKIEKAVNYLKEYPDANVVVTGYADRKTGYPAYNMRLSERRAKAVSNALIERYGINPLRISINWEGDRIQPFEVNEWNRVVVFVIE